MSQYLVQSFSDGEIKPYHEETIEGSSLSEILKKVYGQQQEYCEITDDNLSDRIKIYHADLTLQAVVTTSDMRE